MSIFSKFFLILVLMVGFSTFVKADPIRIVSGTVNRENIILSDNNSTNINLHWNSGPIFTFGNFSLQVAPGAYAFPIIEGFGANGSFASFSFRASAIINGITYAPNNSYFGGGIGFNNLTFTPTQSFQLPSAPNSGDIFTVQIPFTMVGYLSGASCPNGLNGPGNCDSIPRVDVFGNGTAKFTYLYFNSSPVWNLQNYEYTFSSTPEPTPEPAAILLLGTGLAGVFGYARRKSRLKKTN